MKLNKLREIIREEVRSAVKEELQEMLTEAVRVASQPAVKPTKEKFVPNKQNQPPVDKISPNSLTEMLNQTKQSMTNEEYRNVFTGNTDMVQKPNFAEMMASNMGMVDSGRPAPGLDISQFDFVKKAGEVYKASLEIDKTKAGIS
jgi:hypothetical protein|tara:strand:- start:1857 stop:2291 length:435 start_codon:yes stop_codon:yes gene_type:complete